MRYKTHIVSSLTLGAGISIITHYPFHIGYVVGISIGSLLPDIDEPNSFIGRRSMGLATYINKKYGHRGITHSLFAWILISIVCLIIPSPLTLGISLGYLFHLLGDFFSVRSIPVFAPLNYNRPKISITYRTGSITENVILYIFSILLFYFIFGIGNLHIYLFHSIAEVISSTIRILLKLLEVSIT
ncbi:metal-dependent hydrolase [Bacillus sp. HNG]|uniref:metal-dependent hydrolase n=1 Tax=Bacillus sp. HNG TaxID=2293325 RepID=UPI000E2FA1A2|nr:metal-dependent hydrolase [Bacillus sp. HNG]RFB13646.1 metal-dependent hydrolase [Bacillus sp. HNG]